MPLSAKRQTRNAQQSTARSNHSKSPVSRSRNKVDGLILIASILADLKFSRVRSRAPIDMPGRLVGNIRADAIEIVPAAALMCLQIARDTGKQKFEARLRIDRWIHKDLLFQSDVCTAVGEAEREARRKPEGLVFIFASLFEIQRGGFGHRRSRRYQGNVHILAETCFRRAAQDAAKKRVSETSDCES